HVGLLVPLGGEALLGAVVLDAVEVLVGRDLDLVEGEVGRSLPGHAGADDRDEASVRCGVHRVTPPFWRSAAPAARPAAGRAPRRGRPSSAAPSTAPVPPAPSPGGPPPSSAGADARGRGRRGMGRCGRGVGAGRSCQVPSMIWTLMEPSPRSCSLTVKPRARAASLAFSTA